MNEQLTRRLWPLGRRRGGHEDRALSAPSTTGSGLIPFGEPTEPLNTTDTVTATSAMGIADVFACVRVLADAAASVPLIAYRKRTDTQRERATGATPTLLGKPAPGTTQASLVAQTIAHLNLYGDAYWGKYRGGGNAVEQLGLMHPDRMKVELVAGVPAYTFIDADGTRVPLTQADVLHIRSPLSVDGVYGLSPIRQCRVALGLAGHLAEHADAFFTEGGRPDGIVTLPNGQTDAADRLKEQWRIKRGGASRGRGIAVISGDLNFTQLSGPLDDMQFVEQRALSTAEVARIFRVPPWMVGASSGDSMTYSNTEQQAQAFVTFSLRPWLVCIEQAVTADADLCRGSLYVEFLLDALLRADHITRAQVYEKALDPERGWMNRAEVRRLENLEPEEAA